MRQLEFPDQQKWEARRAWFERLTEGTDEMAGYLVCEQSCALTIDLQAIYCAGAWTAVIILAVAIIDAHLRDTDFLGFKGNTKQLFDLVKEFPDLDWLRIRRNQLVHLRPKPAITVDDQWDKYNELEKDACKAIELVFGVMFMNPMV